MEGCEGLQCLFKGQGCRALKLKLQDTTVSPLKQALKTVLLVTCKSHKIHRQILESVNEEAISNGSLLLVLCNSPRQKGRWKTPTDGPQHCVCTLCELHMTSNRTA